MAWESYNLDREAQELVLKYRDHDVLNESHKMRATVDINWTNRLVDIIHSQENKQVISE